MEIASLIPWGNLFDWLVEFFSNRKLERIENRRKYFEEHVHPVFELIEKIHKDYQATFLELFKILSDKETLTIEIADWLESRRLQYETERMRVRAIRHEVENSRLFLDAIKDVESENFKIAEASLEFVDSIISYFYNSNNMAELSWYSDFIEILRNRVSLYQARLRQNPELKQPKGVYILSINANIRGEVEEVMRQSLPQRYEAVSRAYAKLKGLCLS